MARNSIWSRCGSRRRGVPARDASKSAASAGSRAATAGSRAAPTGGLVCSGRFAKSSSPATIASCESNDLSQESTDAAASGGIGFRTAPPWQKIHRLVEDPYRCLEKGNDKKVHDWSVAQDNRTRAYLDALAARKPIHDRLMRLTSETSPSYSGL